MTLDLARFHSYDTKSTGNFIFGYIPKTNENRDSTIFSLIFIAILFTKEVGRNKTELEYQIGVQHQIVTQNPQKQMK